MVVSAKLASSSIRVKCILFEIVNVNTGLLDVLVILDSINFFLTKIMLVFSFEWSSQCSHWSVCYWYILCIFVYKLLHNAKNVFTVHAFQFYLLPVPFQPLSYFTMLRIFSLYTHFNFIHLTSSFVFSPLQITMLSKMSEAIRTNLTKIQRLKIVALVTIEVHARDIIEKLIKSGCNDVTAFEWLSQLRVYWDRVSTKSCF